MKILVTGAGGQLGQTFVELCNAISEGKTIEVCVCNRAALDISNYSEVLAKIKQEKPDYVVNAAAYTAVDKAESDQEAAYLVNHTGAENLAKACAESNVSLIHISTDYVFDGSKAEPYLETDLAKPTGIYGLSKFRGEEAVRTHLERHIILRVSWVFGVYGNNFVKTIQRLAREREELKIVEDQQGCPTSTENISKVILAIIDKMNSASFEQYGTYHYCDEPESNWFEFANAIVDETRKHEELAVKEIKAIPSSEFPTPAARPMNSRLDCSKLKKIFNIDQHSWRLALGKMIAGLE